MNVLRNKRQNHFEKIAWDKTSLKVNSVLKRETKQPISTSILSNKFWNIKSILFWQGFHAVTKLLNAMKIRKNQFIWCLKSRDKAKVSYSQKCGSLEIYSDVIGRAGCFISNGTLKSGLLSADKGFNPKQSLLNKIFRSYETKSSINI